MDNKTQPIFKNKAGTISSAIFERKFEREDFKTHEKITITKYGTVLSRGYQNKKGEWQNEKINFVNTSELRKAIFLLEEAEHKILMKDIVVTGLPEGHNYKDNTRCICGHTLLEHDWKTISNCKVKGCKCKCFKVDE